MSDVTDFFNNAGLDYAKFQTDLTGLPEDKQAELNAILTDMAEADNEEALMGIGMTVVGFVPGVGSYSTAGLSVVSNLLALLPGPSAMEILVDGLRKEFKAYVSAAILEYDVESRMAELIQLSSDLGTYTKGVALGVYDTPETQCVEIQKLFDAAHNYSLHYQFMKTSGATAPAQLLFPFIIFLNYHAAIITLYAHNIEAIGTEHPQHKIMKYKMETEIPKVFVGTDGKSGYKGFVSESKTLILKQRGDRVHVDIVKRDSGSPTIIQQDHVLTDDFDGTSKVLGTDTVPLPSSLGGPPTTFAPVEMDKADIKRQTNAYINAAKTAAELAFFEKIIKPLCILNTMDPFQSIFTKSGFTLEDIPYEIADPTA